ncbi:MAG: protoheme IX farnesyltransferase, partial [Candidatus Hodarchaeota archaeon]
MSKTPELYLDSTTTNTKITSIISKCYIPWSHYTKLIKTRQTLVLLFTAFFAFLVSAWQTNLIDLELLWRVIWLIGSLFLVITGSTFLNMYFDRDIDALMKRTKDRPLPDNQVNSSIVFIYGLIFCLVGTLASSLFLNFLTTIVIFLGFFFDVIVYSLLLKRRTRFSIFFGAIAGGLPAVAGRTAVINTIDLTTILMGLLVISWVPLHILTLAMLPENLEDYKQAKVPMWPVVKGQLSTIRLVAFSALCSGLFAFLLGIILEIQLIIFLPLLLFSFYLIYRSISVLIHSTERKVFILFKLASIFMVFSFLWLFIGV